MPATQPNSQISAVLKRLAQPADRDVTVKNLIALGPSIIPDLVTALADPQEDIRAGVAEALRTLTKDPAKVPGYHTQKFWEARIAQLHPGMSVTDALANLRPDLTAEQCEKSRIMSRGSGQTSTSQYRLDDYWVITIYAVDGGGLHPDPPLLSGSANRIWVEPPGGFTGTWTTWFVNGQKSYAIVCTRRVSTMAFFEAFFDNGTKCYEQHYNNGQIIEGR